MSKADDLKKSIQEEIEKCDEFLNKAKDIKEIVPSIQERKEEAEAKVKAINNLPDDVLEEVAPQILHAQERDRERLYDALPILPEIDTVLILENLYTTAASSDSELIASFVREQPIMSKWSRAFMEPFNQLAEKQGRVTRICASYSRVNEDLGKIIDLATSTVTSARGGVADIDHASLRLRNVVQKVWGELADMARAKCPGRIGNRRLQLIRQNHRKMVAECVATSDDKIEDIQLLLNNLSSLHSDLSVRLKDPLIDDMDYLVDVHTRWTLHLYNLSRVLNL